MKKSLVISLIFLAIVLFLALSSAITASIGNSRMVLRVNPKQTIEKSILVKNINNVSVNIEMAADGDLAKELILKSPNFTLAPGEEKEAKFTIYSPKEGTSTTKINVKFIPKQGPSVGLSSTVVLIAGNSSDEISDEETSNDSDTISNKTSSFLNSLFNRKTVNSSFDNETASNISLPKISISPIILLSLSTLVLLLALLILMIVATKVKKRQARR